MRPFALGADILPQGQNSCFVRIFDSNCATRGQPAACCAQAIESTLIVEIVRL
jgi:hypothetical protein